MLLTREMFYSYTFWVTTEKGQKAYIVKTTEELRNTLEDLFHYKMRIELIEMATVAYFYHFVFKMENFFSLMYYLKAKELYDADFEFDPEE